MSLAVHLKSLPQHTLSCIPDGAKSNLKITKPVSYTWNKHQGLSPYLALNTISIKLKMETRTNQFQKPQGKPV